MAGIAVALLECEEHVPSREEVGIRYAVALEAALASRPDSVFDTRLRPNNGRRRRILCLLLPRGGTDTVLGGSRRVACQLCRRHLSAGLSRAREASSARGRLLRRPRRGRWGRNFLSGLSVEGSVSFSSSGKRIRPRCWRQGERYGLRLRYELLLLL